MLPCDHPRSLLDARTVNGGTYYLFYDAFYAYSLSGSGESEGWAIGRSAGSNCGDDHGYCRCGNGPAACCTDGPSCTRYLVKQSGQVSGTACQSTNNYDRSLPHLSGNGDWKTMKLITGSLYGNCNTRFSTNWGVSSGEIPTPMSLRARAPTPNLSPSFRGTLVTLRTFLTARP